MTKKATKRAWTTEEIRTLKTYAKRKTPAGKIAKTLKRTQGANSAKGV